MVSVNLLRILRQLKRNKQSNLRPETDYHCHEQYGILNFAVNPEMIVRGQQQAEDKTDRNRQPEATVIYGYTQP